MRALVVYESMFGSTRTIAEAVAIGLSTRGIDVEASEVSATDPHLDDRVDLLVVGAPTHTFTLSRPETRASAAEKSTRELVSPGIGLREWLDGLPRAGAAAIATFDTHVDKHVPGSAAKSAHRRLRQRGYHALVPAMSFYVSGTDGPLVEGEIERARAWGGSLGDACRRTRHISDAI